MFRCRHKIIKCYIECSILILYFLMVDIQTNPLYYAAVGGILLGIATSLHYVLKGNVTGISGIIYDVAFFNLKQFPNKLIIIGGILVASGIFFDIFGYSTFKGFTPFGPKNNISDHTSFLGFALAGLLVGFGTKLGNGCTSGHGLCGLPRLSIRSFVAVGIFLTSAIGIATLKYYVTLGPFSQNLRPNIDYTHLISANLCISFGILFIPVGFIIDKLYNKQNQENSVIFRDNIISFVVGFIFGIGLLVAGMVRRINILQFLWMGVDWNPSLLFVLGCGVIINLIVFNYMIRVKKTPIYGDKLFNPENSLIDWKLVLGALCFGIGWGIGGICPGPALALLSVFQIQIHVIWFACMIIGMFCASKIVQLSQKNKNKEEQKQIQQQSMQKVIVINKISNENMQNSQKIQLQCQNQNKYQKNKENNVNSFNLCSLEVQKANIKNKEQQQNERTPSKPFIGSVPPVEIEQY